MVFYAILGDAATGVYLAVDVAIMFLVLPNKGYEVRDMALLALATIVPAAIAPLVAAGIFQVTGGYIAVFLFAVVFTVLGAVFMLLVRGVR